MLAEIDIYDFSTRLAQIQLNILDCAQFSLNAVDLRLASPADFTTLSY